MCVRARAWHSVVCGQWVAWRAHWPFNHMEQDQQVRARFFLCRRRGEGSGSLPFFWWVEITFDLGVEMSWWFFLKGNLCSSFMMLSAGLVCQGRGRESME